MFAVSNQCTLTFIRSAANRVWCSSVATTRRSGSAIAGAISTGDSSLSSDCTLLRDSSSQLAPESTAHY
jgi:hypothetical protein